MTTEPVAYPVAAHELARIVAGRHHSPHDVLGPHVHGEGKDRHVTVRVLRPLASSIMVTRTSGQVAMTHEHDGVWLAVLPEADISDYRLEVEYPGHAHQSVDDPYRFLPTLGEIDQHLINEGRHEELWNVLGAHVRRYDTPGGTVVGTSFAVWAPNALGVRVAGDFNYWDARAHPMRKLGSSGVWELFIPAVGSGALYKFDVCGADGIWRQKADPLARHTQVPPERASVVFESTYEWADDGWLGRRAAEQAVAAPMSVYEVH
ncbi:MAG: 1,4-alpha-glucan branching enzyme, partial [Propionibacteriales bacterium]|nr:1,4-alpha-glucan branching enzyme [Propionibacteriales bacterium]